MRDRLFWAAFIWDKWVAVKTASLIPCVGPCPWLSVGSLLLDLDQAAILLPYQTLQTRTNRGHRTLYIHSTVRHLCRDTSIRGQAGVQCSGSCLGSA